MTSTDLSVQPALAASCKAEEGGRGERTKPDSVARTWPCRLSGPQAGSQPVRVFSWEEAVLAQVPT